MDAPRIPIVVSLDLHGVLTDRMLQHSDAVAMYHTFPHVDFCQTGQRATRLLMRILAGEVNPVRRSLPMMLSVFPKPSTPCFSA
jgi:microcystin degradation protein MlrC